MMKLKLHQGKNTGPAKIYSRLSSSRSSASTLSYSRMAVTSPLTFKAPLVNEMPSSSKSSPASSKYAYLHVPDQNKNINECYQLLRRKYKKYQIHNVICILDSNHQKGVTDEKNHQKAEKEMQVQERVLVTHAIEFPQNFNKNSIPFYAYDK